MEIDFNAGVFDMEGRFPGVSSGGGARGMVIRIIVMGIGGTRGPSCVRGQAFQEVVHLGTRVAWGFLKCGACLRKAIVRTSVSIVSGIA